MTTTNGFAYRTDDYAETFASAPYNHSQTINLGGWNDCKDTDKDMIKFTLASQKGHYKCRSI